MCNSRMMERLESKLRRFVKKWLAVSNFLLKKHSIPETGFQIFSAATHRLLLTAVDPLGGTKPGKGGKGFERFLQEDSGAERNELLGEAGEVGNELRAEEAGEEVPDYICLEGDPWGGAQLWNNLDRM